MLIFRHASKPHVRIQIDRYTLDLFGEPRTLYVGELFDAKGPARTIEYTSAGSAVSHAIGPRSAAYSERGLTGLMYKLVGELQSVRS